MTTLRNRHGDAYHSYDYRRALLPDPGGEFDMWRYRSLLPASVNPPARPPVYPLRVGGTPLRPAKRLRAAVGLTRLWLKDETVGPSASNKDRATALVIEDGLRRGATVITTSSTGNAAAATAIGAAATGLGAVLFVPHDCLPAKVDVMTAAGAHVFRVLDGYRAAFELSREVAARFGWIDRNTGVNPLTIEAKKTVAFEIWEQLGRRAPDTVLVPVGDGATIVGMAKGFRELAACGVIRAVPRLIGVQARACAPFAHTWHGVAAGSCDAGATMADGIAVPTPSLEGWVLDEVRYAGGTFVTVSDEDIRIAMRGLDRHAGVPSEPAGAAAFAGAREAFAAGLLTADETVVALVSGADRPSRALPGRRRGHAWTIAAGLGAVADKISEVLPEAVPESTARTAVGWTVTAQKGPSTL
jgi:threonine synthase